MKEEIFATYAADSDITFIMRDITENGEPRSTEVVGWYYGEPTEENTAFYIGKLKAEY